MLNLLLSGDFLDAEVLRSQAEATTVAGGCDCGCPSVALSVEFGGSLARTSTDGLVPQEGLVEPLSDDGPAGNIILFTEQGRLSYLEYVYFTEHPPTAWPDAAQVRLIR